MHIVPELSLAQKCKNVLEVLVQLVYRIPNGRWFEVWKTNLSYVYINITMLYITFTLIKFFPQDDWEDEDEVNDDFHRKLYEAQECDYVLMRSMKRLCKLGQKFVLKKVIYLI